MAGGWVDGALCGLDLETDSPDPEDARLVTAAFLRHVPGRALVVRQWTARPTRPISDGAARIHGFTTDRAEAEGAPIGAVIEEIVTVLSESWSWECPLLTCNSPFDLTIIDRERGRHLGGGYKLSELPPVVDTLLVDRMCDRFRPGSRRLSDTCRHYGVTLDGAHDAAADALATMRLAWKLARRRADSWPSGRYGPSPEQVEAWNVVASGDIGGLFEAERRWFRTHSLQLADYFRSPSAIAKVERDHAVGAVTRGEADELIRTLPDRAESVAQYAGGWPMRPRRGDTPTTVAVDEGPRPAEGVFAG